MELLENPKTACSGTRRVLGWMVVTSLVQSNSLLNAKPAMIDDRAELEAVLRSHEKPLRALGVRRLGVFGSFSRDQQRQDSDVDLLVEFEEGAKTFDHFMDLAFLLEELLDRRVELVTLEALSPHIGPHILREVHYVTLPG